MLQEIPRPGLWKRLLIGGLLIVFAAAGATAVAAFHEVDKVVDALKENPELKLGANALATTDPGKPQTILILGSDRRPKNNAEGAGGARSDTINASYELGGPALTLETVKQLTGLNVNHVVNVTFKGFWRAVNAIGCVYA